jgi:hypothetical protein
VIKKLMKIANELDRRGLRREADMLDAVILKVSAKKKKAVYTGAFLTPLGIEELRNWWKATVKEELLDNLFMHHMTIKYRPSEEEVVSLPIGESVKLKVVGYASDERGQAVLVSGASSSNEHPHITVSTATNPDTDKKISPAYSKELLGKGVKEVAEKDSIFLEARIGFFNSEEVKYDFEGSIYELDQEDGIVL